MAMAQGAGAAVACTEVATVEFYHNDAENVMPKPIATEVTTPKAATGIHVYAEFKLLGEV